MTTSRARRRQAQRRTIGRWLDDLIRAMERRAVGPAAAAQPNAPPGRRPTLRLRRDLNLILGL